MKNTGILAAALIILQPLWWGSAHSEEPAGPKFDVEVSKQDSILFSRGEQRPAGYVIDRSLDMYAETLSADFDRTLAGLGPNDRWLDIGAGEGQAVLDYWSAGYDAAHPARRGGKAQTIAMSIEDRRTPLWHQMAAILGANRIQYLINKRLREYSREELGQFQVITDVIGGFSYTQSVTVFMEKVLGFLTLNGSFFTVLQDVSSEAGTNKPFYQGAPYLTEIKNADGSDVKICSWLKSIACVEVTCELKMGWKPPIEVYRIRKACNEVKVPALEPIHYQAGTPPERRFQVKN